MVRSGTLPGYELEKWIMRDATNKGPIREDWFFFYVKKQGLEKGENRNYTDNKVYFDKRRIRHGKAFDCS